MFLDNILKYRHFKQILLFKFRKCCDNFLQNATFIKGDKILIPGFSLLQTVAFKIIWKFTPVIALVKRCIIGMIYFSGELFN